MQRASLLNNNRKSHYSTNQAYDSTYTVKPDTNQAYDSSYTVNHGTNQAYNTIYK